MDGWMDGWMVIAESNNRGEQGEVRGWRERGLLL